MGDIIELPLKKANQDDLFQFFQGRFEAHYEQHEVDVLDYEQTMKDLQKNLNKKGPKMFDGLIQEYGEIISTTVITTFGLGPFFHKGDKIGGNVTTMHNAQQGIYSKKSEEYTRNDYNYSSSKDKVLAQNLNENGYYKDGYTGLETESPNVDHIIPLNSFHKNGGFMLSKEARKNFSNDKRNLIVTDESLNKSKLAQDLNEFMEKTVAGQDDNNKERFEMDKRRTNAAANRANKAYDEHIPSKREKVSYFFKNGAKSSSQEAITIGARQAWGMFIYVFSKELFDELKIYGKKFKQYQQEGRLMAEIKEMLGRVKSKVFAQLGNIVTAFKDGVISGFFSSILTTIINCFYTTSKRLVRIIREGFLSIFRALKLLMFPPKGVSKKEVYREAIKLLISGLFVSGGIIMEELLEKKLAGLGVPLTIANIISTTLTGILTGIAIATVVYMIDHLVSSLPSTKELIEKSNELIQNRKFLEADYGAATANIRYSVQDNFLPRIRKTEKEIDDLVNFFEE